jgi:CheY-like chemotaxis protein
LHTLYTEEYSRELVNAFDQGFCTIEVLFDGEGTPNDYRFIEVNAAFVHHTGLRDAVGRRMRDLAPAHEAHWFEIYGQVAVTGLPVRFEHQAAALERWYDVYAFRVGDPRLRRVAVMFSDISARKRAELGMAAARVEAEKANRAKDEFLAIDAVFEPFVQQAQSIERAAGGLGLGLAIVRNIVSAHGGTVRAESKGIGHGAEFIVELPAVDVASERADAAHSADASAAGPQKRILIVDDNRDMAEMLRIALEQLGHLVEIAFDGPSALARVQEFRPSTVLLDIGLPVMDGYEVARRLRAVETPAHPLRLLAVTGYGQAEDRRHAREAGFDHHLVKPIDLDELERILATGMPGAA